MGGEREGDEEEEAGPEFAGEDFDIAEQAAGVSFVELGEAAGELVDPDGLEVAGIGVVAEEVEGDAGEEGGEGGDPETRVAEGGAVLPAEEGAGLVPVEEGEAV